MKNLYPTLAYNQSIHFYDNICIIRNSKNNLYYFDEAETDILELCNGENTLFDIKSKILSIYGATDDIREDAQNIISMFIDNLIKKDLLEYNLLPTNKGSLKITGERYKYYPRNICLELTNICNLKCEHCFKEANTNGSFLSSKNFEYIVNTLKNKTFEIQLTGGEPLIHPKINEFLEKIVDNFYISIITNGTYLNKIHDTLLKKVGFIQISMYGTNSEEYKNMTGSSDAFFKFKEGIEKIVKNKVDHLVTVVLNQNNIDYMEEYVKILSELGVKKLKFGMPSPLGRAISDDHKRNKWNINQNDEIKAYSNLKYLNEKYKNKIEVVIWKDFQLDDFKTTKQNIIEKNYENSFSCGAGFLSFNINQEGRLRPCQLLPQDIFDMGEIQLLGNIVNNFSDNDWKGSIQKYDSILKLNKVSSEKICSALSKFL